MSIALILRGVIRVISPATKDLLRKILVERGKAAAQKKLADLIHRKSGVDKAVANKAASRFINTLARDVRRRIK